MRKTTLLLLSLTCLALSASAQEFKTKLGNAKDRKVILEMDAGDYKLEGYDGDELIIRASSGLEAPPERAKGLKPLYYNAVDNSGIGLAVTSESGALKIEKATRKDIDYTIRVPKKAALLVRQTNWRGGAISISNMDGDLEIKTNNAPITLKSVTGPVVANTTNGEVNVIYTNLSQEKPSSITTISGIVDVTLPANAKTSLKMRSINGEMYTDFDLGLKNSRDGLSKVGGGNNIEGTTNGGGVEIQLNTISSNIYIRKQK
ncbi:DUF4097 family beta strand repeat-containing protein [Larkinella sp. VNQ87]|uniref:DUF4097 family beta strand repeat-containing protein n=1 Tax=Larkinella sp. VNQ87 TaxID=3400921 RepID=UPI003C06C72F